MMPSGLFFKTTFSFWFLCWCYGISEALLCYSCWKLICNEDYEACYEMRHFPSANSRNRDISRHWRTSPECPADGNDLRWSKSYIQNCSEGETSCGTYLIQVSAAISKNSINETEFPILVTPNYYEGTIIALGCIPAREELTDVDNSTSISLNAPPYHTVESNDTRRNSTEIHMAPHVIRKNKKRPGHGTVSSTTAPSIWATKLSKKTASNVTKINNNGYNTTEARNQTIQNTSNSTTINSRGDNGTILNPTFVATSPKPSSANVKGDFLIKENHPLVTAPPEQSTANTKGDFVIKENHPLVAAPPEQFSANTKGDFVIKENHPLVAVPPEQFSANTKGDFGIKENHPLVAAPPENSPANTRGDYGTNANYPLVAAPPEPASSNATFAAGYFPVSGNPSSRTLPEPLPVPQPFLQESDVLEAVVPILTFTWKSLHDEICKEDLTHFESRDSYGTTTRINMTGKFYVCNSCSDDLCNIVIPSDADITTESPIDEDYDNTIEGSSAGTIITFSYLHFLSLAIMLTLIRAS